jgi:hypothetical protein
MNITFDELDVKLGEIFEIPARELNRSVERTLLRLVAPNAETSFNLKKFRSPKEWIRLAIYSWYLPKIPRILLQEELRGLRPTTSFYLYEVRGLLFSKEKMLAWVLASFSERDFFGNQVRSLKSTACRLHFYVQFPRQGKKKIRHRGYQDKGSCRPRDRWLPSRDLSLTEKNNQYENRKDFREMLLRMVDQYGPLGRSLPKRGDKKRSASYAKEP